MRTFKPKGRFDKKEMDIAKAIQKSPRMLKKMFKVYNMLCPKCKKVLMSKQKYEYDDFCPKCQKKAGKILKSYTKKGD